jgi:hypothetical protein
VQRILLRRIRDVSALFHSQPPSKRAGAAQKEIGV